MAPLGVGLVGCGGIAHAHVRDYYARQPEEARLIACCEVEPGARERFAKEFGVSRTYESIEELVSDPDIAAIDICTPPSTHPNLVRVAARAGKHVLCEKPFALDLADAREAVDVAERSSVLFGVMQNYRFRPEYIDARGYVARKAIGRPFFATLEAFYHWNGGANYRKDAKRMLIIEQTYHYIDLLRFILGDDVVRVYAAAGHLETAQAAGETWASVTLHFAGGAVGTIVNSGECYGFPANWGGSAVIQGTAGTIEINRRQLYTLGIYLAGGGGRLPDQVYSTDLYSPNTNAPFTVPMTAFFAAARAGQKPPVSGRDNLNTLATALGCYDSIERGQAVDISS